MTRTPEQLYLESTVYTATPEQLVHLVYETAIEAIRRAIEAMDHGDIVGRARAITQATACVMELAGSLNVEAGGELGVRLAVLYEYLLHELLEANVRQTVKPLRDCERVLSSLLDGWTAVIQQLEQSASEALEARNTAAELPQASGPASARPPAPSPLQPHPLPGFAASSEEDQPFEEIDLLESTVNILCG